MTVEELKALYAIESPMYLAWGNFIVSEVQRELKGQIGSIDIDSIIKIPPKPRLKSLSSLIGKAFHRNKKYKDPYADIEDKVGVRFVVLLRSQIDLIESIITSSPQWTFGKARDFEEEVSAQPLLFDYQSVHYVLRAKKDMSLEGVKIIEGTPCEVQIRTLLQHAHCEMAHDVTYKPKTIVVPSVKREIARSLALVESADAFFEKAYETINSNSAITREFYSCLCGLYTKKIGFDSEFDERTNHEVIDSLLFGQSKIDFREISDYFEKKGFLFSRIKGHCSAEWLFSQPFILLLYFLVQKEKTAVRERWPFAEEVVLASVYSDLGVAASR